MSLLDAIKRTPGNIVGGPADLSNLILGALAGKGISGFVAQPVGGSNWINSRFGLESTKTLADQTAEAVLGMATPSGMAKGAVLGLSPLVASLAAGMKGVNVGTNLSKQAGVIAPINKHVADTLGIQSVVDRVLSMAAEGKSTWKSGVESEKALREMRNPGGALSVFIGPEGIPRLKIDPAVAQLAPSFKSKLFESYRSTPRDNSFVRLPSNMHYKNEEWLGAPVKLSDIMLHPSLYDISPTLANADVRTSLLVDASGALGAYNKNLNTITLPITAFAPHKLANDPVGSLLETLLHESTHGLQAAAKVREGGSPEVADLVKQLTAARTQGSYRSPDQLDQLQKYIENIGKMPDGKLKDARIEQMYLSNYGEWEARQGSQYGRSLPLMNERGATY